LGIFLKEIYLFGIRNVERQEFLTPSQTPKFSQQNSLTA